MNIQLGDDSVYPYVCRRPVHMCQWQEGTWIHGGTEIKRRISNMVSRNQAEDKTPYLCIEEETTD